MAEKKEPMAKAAPQQTAEKKEPKGILYPAEELAKAAHRFNTKKSVWLLHSNTSVRKKRPSKKRKN